MVEISKVTFRVSLVVPGQFHKCIFSCDVDDWNLAVDR